jgi:hypothetical protein
MGVLRALDRVVASGDGSTFVLRFKM